MSARKAYRQRQIVALNAVQIAINRARKLEPEDVTLQTGIVRRAIDGLKLPADDAECVTCWKGLADARKAFADELTKQGIQKSYGNLDLSKDVKDLIAMAARSKFNAEIEHAVTAVAKPALDAVDRKLRSELDAGLGTRLNLLAKQALREALPKYAMKSAAPAPTKRADFVKAGDDATIDGKMVGRVLRVVDTASVPYAVVRWPACTGRHTITTLRKA